jgi:phosphate transport system substrate-binding protein
LENLYKKSTKTFNQGFNGRNTKAIKQAFNTLLSDEYQDKAPSLGFVPLKGDILEKSRAAVKRIGK